MITQNIIGYELSDQSQKYVQSFDPAAMTSLPERFAVAAPDDVHRAMDKAIKAWRIYRAMEGSERAAFLRQIADGIEALGDTLVQRIMQETAYPASRIMVERNRTCAQLRMFAQIAEDNAWPSITIDAALPDRTPAPRPELIKTMMSIGPVGVFGASNFPLAYSTAGGDTASALAVGCPVIVKSHDAHPGTNALVAEVIMKAAQATGMPDGVFSSLNGDGMSTGKLLVQHPDTAAVGFTGSRAGGRTLFDLGAQRDTPIPVFAEMGSINPVFVLPGKMKSDPKALAKMLASSITMTVGQFCTNPGLMVAMGNDDTVAFIQAIQDEIRLVEAATMLTPGILMSFHAGISGIREMNGVEMLAYNMDTSSSMAMPVVATTDAGTFLNHKQLHQEIFGPYSLLVLCQNDQEMMDVARHLEGQLTATLHTSEDDIDLSLPLTEILKERVGRIIFNGVPTGVEVCAAMTHGGPYPASTDSRFTAVGHHAIYRWLRPVTFQNVPDSLRNQLANPTN